jgi:hypothetical protein
MVSAGPSRALVNTTATTLHFDCPSDCSCCDELNSPPPSDACACAGSAQWSQTNLDWFRDTNLYTLVDSTLSPLTGTYAVAVTNDNADVGILGGENAATSTEPPTIQVSITLENGTSSMVAVKPGMTVDDGTSYKPLST